MTRHPWTSVLAATALLVAAVAWVGSRDLGPVPSEYRSVGIAAVLTFAVATLLALLERNRRLLARQNEALEARVVERTRALAAEAERTRLIVENALDGAIGMDASGRILALNPQAERIFGRRASDAIGRDLAELLIPERLRDAHRAGLATFLRSGVGTVLGRRLELSALRADGSEFPLELAITPIAYDGTLAFHAFVRDIGERRRAEAENVRAREAAEAADRAKSEFVANMSHEIRTPMNGVLGMLELLRDTELTAEQRDYVETIRGSSQSLLAIIDDILDFSKIEAGRLELESIPFELGDVVEDAVELFAEKAHQRGLELLCSISRELGEFVLGDPTRVRQIVLNLVSNALKFTERGSVQVRVAPLGDHAAGGRVAIEVVDTGVGIAPEGLARLFRSFSQADGSTTRKYGGTGLGLAICQRLAELMGGAITVASRVGEGTTFRVELELPVAVSPALPAVASRLGSARVLCLDDSAELRQVLVQQIQGAVLAVEAHARPEDALARLRAAARAGEPFDLLLLDLGLGARDGLDVLRELRAAPELASLRVVVLTGQLQRRSEAFDHGAHAVLGKPARRRQLLATLGRLAGDGAVPPGGRQGGEPRERLDARVLLADDNPVNQRVAARLLERMGCEVELAGDGAEAVDLASREDFDVILMDCQMPSLDGYMATRAIREREGRGGRRRTIIAMTANAMAGDREKCLDAGMDDYVTKPIRGELLRATLERWLARRARR